MLKTKWGHVAQNSRSSRSTVRWAPAHPPPASADPRAPPRPRPRRRRPPRTVVPRPRPRLLLLRLRLVARRRQVADLVVGQARRQLAARADATTMCPRLAARAAARFASSTSRRRSSNDRRARPSSRRRLAQRRQPRLEVRYLEVADLYLLSSYLEHGPSPSSGPGPRQRPLRRLTARGRARRRRRRRRRPAIASAARRRPNLTPRSRSAAGRRPPRWRAARRCARGDLGAAADADDAEAAHAVVGAEVTRSRACRRRGAPAAAHRPRRVAAVDVDRGSVERRAAAQQVGQQDEAAADDAGRRGGASARASSPSRRQEEDRAVGARPACHGLLGEVGVGASR